MSQMFTVSDGTTHLRVLTLYNEAMQNVVCLCKACHEGHTVTREWIVSWLVTPQYTANSVSVSLVHWLHPPTDVSRKEAMTVVFLLLTHSLTKCPTQGGKSTSGLLLLLPYIWDTQCWNIVTVWEAKMWAVNNREACWRTKKIGINYTRM